MRSHGERLCHWGLWHWPIYFRHIYNSFFLTFVRVLGAVVTIDFHCIATVYDVVIVCC